MSNNKQSSVDFYRIESQKLIDTNMRGGITIEEYFQLEEILYNKAKAMHKEEHRKTYNQLMMSNFQTFEDYYNSTFEGEDTK